MIVALNNKSNFNDVYSKLDDSPKVIKELIEPTWLIKKFCVLNDIDKEMVRRDTYQGKLFTN